MPKLQFATKWNNTSHQDQKFYPISITPGIIDTQRNQRLNTTLASIENKADQALTAIGAPNMVDISFEFADTGAFNMLVTTPDQQQ